MFDSDYRFEVKLALQVFKSKRKKLSEDSLNYNPDLYFGLHESEKVAARNVYFQYYETIWLSEHWNDMTELLESHTELRKNEKKQMTIFFSEYFSGLISGCSERGEMSKIIIPELLEIQKEQLHKLIEYSEKWEEISNIMKLQTKKNKEKFKKIIDETKKQKVGN